MLSILNNSVPTETELELAIKQLSNAFMEWPLEKTLNHHFPPFLKDIPADDEGAIDRLSKMIGTCQPKHSKLGLRMSVQIMLHQAIKIGLLLGFIISNQRRQKVI